MLEEWRPGQPADEVRQALERCGADCAQYTAGGGVQLYAGLRLFGTWEGRARLNVDPQYGLCEISWVPDYGSFTKEDSRRLAQRLAARYGPPDPSAGADYWREAEGWLVSAADGFVVWEAL